jgi:hypothetical protein
MPRPSSSTTVILMALLLTAFAVPETVDADERSHATGVAPAGRTGSLRPDEWIKLCGLSTGCTIHPSGVTRHWLGNGVYNRTGRMQQIAVEIDDGEDARWWIMVENDGADTDTLVVDGSRCRGTRVFEVRHVLLGKQDRPSSAATDVTRKFKQGTLTFDLDAGESKVFTVLVVTHEPGVTYVCPITTHSENDSTLLDTVVAKMTTF